MSLFTALDGVDVGGDLVVDEDGQSLWQGIPFIEDGLEALGTSASPVAFEAKATFPTPPPEKQEDPQKNDGRGQNSDAKRKLDFDLGNPVPQLHELADAIMQDHERLKRKCQQLDDKVASLTKALNDEVNNSRMLKKGVLDMWEAQRAMFGALPGVLDDLQA